MSEYPDNSHSGRENATSLPNKKPEKVISGTAKTRKKSEVKKIAGIFIPEDVESVKTYILMDVIVPGIKNALGDIVSLMLFGETGHIGGKSTRNGKVMYNRMYSDDRRDDRGYARPRAAGSFDLDDILFETRGDAELVLDQLDGSIAQYGIVSVGDLYDFAGLTPPNYIANKYGWTDIRSAKVIPVRGGGYTLSLPRAMQIK